MQKNKRLGKIEKKRKIQSKMNTKMWIKNGTKNGCLNFRLWRSSFFSKWGNEKCWTKWRRLNASECADLYPIKAPRSSSIF